MHWLGSWLPSTWKREVVSCGLVCPVHSCGLTVLASHLTVAGPVLRGMQIIRLASRLSVLLVVLIGGGVVPIPKVLALPRPAQRIENIRTEYHGRAAIEKLAERRQRTASWRLQNSRLFHGGSIGEPSPNFTVVHIQSKKLKVPKSVLAAMVASLAGGPGVLHACPFETSLLGDLRRTTVQRVRKRFDDCDELVSDVYLYYDGYVSPNNSVGWAAGAQLASYAWICILGYGGSSDIEPAWRHPSLLPSAGTQGSSVAPMLKALASVPKGSPLGWRSPSLLAS